MKKLEKLFLVFTVIWASHADSSGFAAVATMANAILYIWFPWPFVRSKSAEDNELAERAITP